MNTQPEALRMADWCEANSSGVYRPSADAAAELRRLHAVEVERDKLRAALLQSDPLPTGWDERAMHWRAVDADLHAAVEQILTAGHMDQEDLARLRAAYSAG